MDIDRTFERLSVPLLAVVLAATGLPGCSNEPDPKTEQNQNTGECPADTTRCEDRCVDTDTDPDYCGECHVSCTAPDVEDLQPVCIDGDCDIECAADQRLCEPEDAGRICVDTETSADHCGGCDRPCDEVANGEVSCRSGECTLECNDGYTDCGGICVDTERDLRHCGDCDSPCGEELGCQNGECVEEVVCHPDQRPFGGGRGTFVQPYLICSFEQLDNLDADGDYADDHFELRSDLDYAAQTAEFRDDFAPLFKPVLTVSGFNGHLDGGGHTISNFEIQRPDRSSIGLFETIADNGTVEDLHFVDPALEGRFSVGTLVGDHHGTIEDVTVQGAEIAGFGRVGTVVGHQRAGSGPLSGIQAGGDVVGVRDIGGVVGRSAGGVVTDVEADVDVDATEKNAGGIVGTFAGLSLEHCVATGPVDALGDAVGAGGVAGRIEGEFDDFEDVWTTEVRDCRASGEVVGDESVGGFVGVNQARVVTARATGPASGHRAVGGLVGTNENGEIRQSVATGTAAPASDGEETDRVGGFAGRNEAEIHDSYALGDTQGVDEVAGFVGYNGGDAEIRRSYSLGSPDGPQTTGGFAATDDGQIAASFWNVDTAGTTDSAGATGRTGGAFADLSTFDDAGWDFDAIWEMSDSDGRPVLQWED